MKKLILICDACMARNYHFKCLKRPTVRFVIKKYCKHCNIHTVHKETR